MSTTLTLPTDASPTTLTVRPWPDGVIDALGHDPRSFYVEHFWLGILGPPRTTFNAIAVRYEAECGALGLDAQQGSCNWWDRRCALVSNAFDHQIAAASWELDLERQGLDGTAPLPLPGPRHERGIEFDGPRVGTDLEIGL